MNSWHTWSADSRWLVFSSKADSDYTQLYLARIDERGEASPPVWLEHMVAPGRAANIPEFVALPPNGIVKVREQFLDDNSFTRAGNEFFRAGDADHAIEKYRIALSMNRTTPWPTSGSASCSTGSNMSSRKRWSIPGWPCGLEPRNPFARFDLGAALAEHGDLTNALVYLAEAARLLPNGYDENYNAVEMHFILAQTQYRLARYAECIPSLEVVLRVAPEHGRANYLMAMARAWQGETRPTLPFFDQAVHSEARLGQLPDFYDLLSRNYLSQGLYDDGLRTSEKARAWPSRRAAASRPPGSSSAPKSAAAAESRGNAEGWSCGRV